MNVRRPSTDTSHLPEQATVNKALLLLNLVLAAAYLFAILFWFPHGSNELVVGIFIAGELFHLWQLATYIYTVWGTAAPHAFDAALQPPVDIFITVAGEPVDLVAKTIAAAKRQDYQGIVTVVVCNDGLVAGKDNWRDIEELAARLGVVCITRTEPGGAKAGNINHALALRTAPFVAVLDADHVPEPGFLSRTVGYFVDDKVAFVQSPQYYANHGKNYVTGGAWEQQDLFFGPIQSGKDRTGSAFMCGTNMVIRRTALEQVGGLCQTNIAEDFLTSLFLHEKGWKSVYVPEVLAQGLAPEDFMSYYKQQHRWARGSLEVIFKYNPLVRRGLRWSQRIQYLSSASYYLSGAVVLMNALLPILFFFTGITVFNISTNALAVVFIPYLCLSLYVLQLSSGFSYTFRALAFSTGSFWLQLSALAGVLSGRKTAFAVTSKKQLTGNFLHLVIPHLVYMGATVLGLSMAVARDGVTASVVTNACWALLACVLFVPMIYAARPARQSALQPVSRPELVPVLERAV